MIGNGKKKVFVSCCLIGILMMVGGCQSAKKSANTNLPDLNSETPVLVETSTFPNEDQSSQPNAEPEIENEPTVEEKLPEPAQPVPSIEEEKPDPQTLLESALEACQQAQADWKAGDMMEALTKLDGAFQSILAIEDDHQDPVILQEKEDLRFLISKRIVEIYASQRTAVGDLKKSIPLVMNQEVEKEISSFQGRERRFFLESYKRSGKYRPMILEELRKAGLPEQLSWLPLIESGFKPNALSRARALGLWQFIPSTGYRYGLERNAWVDERMDPYKSTKSAIAYLEDLHSLFGDWMTVLAGYNCGEGRVLRTINRQRINYLDNFWDLYGQLPRETARYVPRFMATLAILENPSKYGFELPDLNDDQEYAVVQIAKSVKLSDIDKMLQLPANTMKNLNPELRYKITPDVAYPLRVPLSMQLDLENGLAALPTARQPSNMGGTHVVRRGETLSAIASRYKASVKAIMATNKLRNSRIYIGQKLKVPGSGRGNDRRSLSSKGKTGSWVTHRVRRGDSLWRIAKQYRTTVENIRYWNKLNSNKLSLNQKLRVLRGHKTTVAGKTYKVRSGDTLARIAQRHGVSLTALLRANSLKKRDRIYPNQELIIP